jgi:hypothetical protein
MGRKWKMAFADRMFAGEGDVDSRRRSEYSERSKHL